MRYKSSVARRARHAVSAPQQSPIPEPTEREVAKVFTIELEHLA